MATKKLQFLVTLVVDEDYDSGELLGELGEGLADLQDFCRTDEYAPQIGAWKVEEVIA